MAHDEKTFLIENEILKQLESFVFKPAEEHEGFSEILIKQVSGIIKILEGKDFYNHLIECV